MTRVTDFRDSALMPPAALTPVPFEAFGDRLATPRRIAAEVVAADGADPALIVDVGSFTGELLEAFLERFPAARGQWTDATDSSMEAATVRLARFEGRVDYRVGCPKRDVSDGTVPAGVDVLMTSWLSAHRSAAAITQFYLEAARLLAPGGWLINIDHVAPIDSRWEQRILGARAVAHVAWEGPPAHHDGPIATREEHLDAYRDAGISDVDVVWESLGTAVFLGRATA